MPPPYASLMNSFGTSVPQPPYYFSISYYPIGSHHDAMPEDFDLERFREMQRRHYPRALSEIRNGRKESHWIWYIFPQLRALGMSSNAVYYGIEGLEEARAYMADPYLSGNLLEITGALLEHRGERPEVLMGSGIDAVKLRSCMTLFEQASDDGLFPQVLDAFFGGERDPETLRILGIGS